MREPGRHASFLVEKFMRTVEIAGINETEAEVAS